MASVVPKVFDHTIAILMHVRNQLDRAVFAQASQAMSLAKRIEFFGIGNSGIVATDAQHKFFRFGIATAAYSDPHVQAMAASVLGQGDWVVAISASGSTRDLLNNTRIAQQSGAQVLAITASGSQLARQADLSLTLDLTEDLEQYMPMGSRMAQLAILDALAVSVALQGGEAVQKNLRRVKSTLKEMRNPENLG